jgi:hypothetical protein
VARFFAGLSERPGETVGAEASSPAANYEPAIVQRIAVRFQPCSADRLQRGPLLESKCHLPETEGQERILFIGLVVVNR